MSKESIKTSINTYIKENGNLAITGQILNSVMNEMVDGLASEEELAIKQDALTLTIKDNGNIVIGNIAGQSQEFMPATPSGDPMHYAYEAAGAVWNGTGADIVKTAPWADMVDDDADKVVTHKTGYWYLNGLGDISTAQMRDIYNLTINFGITHNMLEVLKSASVRTNFFLYNRDWAPTSNMQSTFVDAKLEVAKLCSDKSRYCGVQTIHSIAQTNQSTRHFIGVLYLNTISQSSGVKNAFYQCTSLKTIMIRALKVSISFPDASMLTSKSILYMITNEAATSAITITLHADAYARAMANADIVAALQAHPNVSLASA